MNRRIFDPVQVERATHAPPILSRRDHVRISEIKTSEGGSVFILVVYTGHRVILNGRIRKMTKQNNFRNKEGYGFSKRGSTRNGLPGRTCVVSRFVERHPRSTPMKN